MKFKSLIYFLFFFCSFDLTCASTIHSFLIFDTDPKDIGISVKKDLDNVRQFLNNISIQTNLTLNEKIFTKDEYNKKIFHYISKQIVHEDDVIFFYFAGHGFHSPENKTPWPQLVLMPTRNYIDKLEVIKALEEKKPRLLLAFSDCCNNISFVKIPKIVRTRHFNFKLMDDNYKKLFLKLKGKVLMTSCSVNQIASGNNIIGGFFTFNLIENFYMMTYENNPTWDKIFNNILQTIKIYNKDQTPVAIIELQEI